MAIKSLRSRLILLLVGLLALVLLAVFVAVYTSTSLSAERQASRQLELGARVFRSVLDARARELTTATQILAADFGFRQAVASGDLPTISSALDNQARRIGADLAMFFDAEGALRIASSPNDDGQVSIQAIAELSPQALVAVIDQQPYLLVDAVLRAPLPVGEVAMAFRLDQTLADELRELTGLDIRFVSSQDGKVVHSLSTLPALQGGPVEQSSGNQTLSLGGERYQSVQLTLLQQTPYAVQVQLVSPLRDLLASFTALKRELLLITLVALLASSLLAVWLAGSLARPVATLAEAARRIGRGDYQFRVWLKRRRADELGMLADSIDLMREGIAEREQQLAHNALHDPLTGLPNLGMVRERLQSAIAGGQSGVLVQCNLDELPQLVKAHGQDLVDNLVCQSAERLMAAQPPGSLLAWQPGSGFVLLLDGRGLNDAVLVVDRLLTLLADKLQIEQHKLRPQWLAGLVEWPRQGSNVTELLRQASMALADAEPGDHRIAVYQAQRDEAYQRRLQLARDIAYAPRHQELSVVYQPKLALANGQVPQVEALMRWQHQGLGPIRPDEFIVLAEQTGSIALLTQWVLDAVLTQVRDWLSRGIELQVAMNISALDLEDPAFPERVERALAEHQVAPRYLSLEVTESALMREPERSLASLQRLRDSGISLAVDDYGTGYSSLAMLKSLPVQYLKIDKSFVLQLTEGSDDAVIVRSTIELAHNMGLAVIAEGIETEESLRWLQQRGCDYAQGYFVSRPVAAEVLETWLSEASSRFAYLAEGTQTD
ncbi:putative bifunctional diguanylate cyclase/phosphodiesterase [Halopseudomonas pachastrellae]|uniref:putative bifunctional diguanylate cyclase/phosphodiesterase n=1 Tax=Halopseudomonas pachastrellae TaxID=254161 RepID=UPI003D7E81CE